jgi:hypothetical protein
MLLQLRGRDHPARAVFRQAQQGGRLWRQRLQAAVDRRRAPRPQQQACRLPHVHIQVLSIAQGSSDALAAGPRTLHVTAATMLVPFVK